MGDQAQDEINMAVKGKYRYTEFIQKENWMAKCKIHQFSWTLVNRFNLQIYEGYTWVHLDMESLFKCSVLNSIEKIF